MSEPTRGHLAVAEPCAMGGGPFGGPPCVTRELSNRCDTCNDNGTRTIPTTIPAHSDEWIREMVDRLRDGAPPGQMVGWLNACHAFLAALDADTGENDGPPPLTMPYNEWAGDGEGRRRER